MAMAMLVSVNLFTACDDDDEDEVVDAIEEWGNNEIQKAMVDGLMEAAPFQASHCISLDINGVLNQLTPIKTGKLDVAYDESVTKVGFALNDKIIGYTESMKLSDTKKTVVANWENSNTILNYGGVIMTSGQKYSIEFDIESNKFNGNLYYQYKNSDDADDAINTYFTDTDEQVKFVAEKLSALGIDFEEFVNNMDNYKFVFVTSFEK